MSAPRDPARFGDSRDELPSVLRDALDAERADLGPDAARYQLMAEKFARFAEGEPRPAKNGGAFARLGRSWTMAIIGLAGLSVVTVGVIAPKVMKGHAAPTSTFASPSEKATVTTQPVMGDAPGRAAEDRPAESSATAEPSLPAELPTMRPADLPMAAPKATAPRASASPRTQDTGAGMAPSDSAEIALLSRAHEVLRDAPSESLALCQKHQSEFPRGHFVQERDALAIEALVYMGRTSEAQRRLDDFRRRHPSSSHRTHLEDLVSTAMSNGR